MGQFNNTVEHLNTFRETSRTNVPEDNPTTDINEALEDSRTSAASNQADLNSFESDEDLALPLEQHDESAEDVAAMESPTEELDHLNEAMKIQQVDHVMTTDSYGKLR